MYVHVFTQQHLRSLTLRFVKLHVFVLLVAWKLLHTFQVKVTTFKSTRSFLFAEAALRIFLVFVTKLFVDHLIHKVLRTVSSHVHVTVLRERRRLANAT